MMVKKLGDALRDIIPKKTRLRDADKAFVELLSVAGEAWSGRMTNLGYFMGRLRIGLSSHADLQEVQFHRSSWEQAMKKGGSRIQQLELVIHPGT